MGHNLRDDCERDDQANRARIAKTEVDAAAQCKTCQKDEGHLLSSVVRELYIAQQPTMAIGC